ncbi:MAG TPA: ATP-binding cassette domain-containing protein, partial [Glaciihabitans sp.]|nr:ATP-binding cassette domain-containing protein [Glaciihabitans sp.]
LAAPQHPYTRSLIAASDLNTTRTSTSTADATAPGDPGDMPELAVTPAIPERSAVLVPHEHLQIPHEQRIFLPAAAEALIEVRSLSRDYHRGASPFGGGPVVSALRDVSFDVVAGQRLGIVGESGSGKSTLLRMLCALDTPTSGSVTMSGQRISGVAERRLRHFRSQVQMVFQDPGGSLDPRMRVEQIVAEPLSGVDRATAKDRVIQALTAVGLEPDVLRRHPHQFSGGQRQRISIARALITRPKVLIADEAVSALDVSVRAEVLALLDSLVADYNLTLIFVSHDLGVIRRSCDTFAVLSKGRIVEAGPTEEVYASPRHNYTRQLVAAAQTLTDGMHSAAGMSSAAGLHRVAGGDR